MARLLQNHAGKIFVGVFLALSAVYFWFIDVSISWYIQQYVFYFDSDTFLSAVKSPAGVSILLANLLSQFFVIKTLAIFIPVLLVFAIYLIYWYILNHFNFSSLLKNVLAILTSLIVLVPLKDYTFPFLYLIEFVIASLFVLFYMQIKAESILFKILKCSILSFLVFYFAGGISLLFFLVSIIMSEFVLDNVKKSLVLTASGILLASLLLVISAKFLFYTNKVETFLGKEYVYYDFFDFKYFIALFFYLPVIIALYALYFKNKIQSDVSSSKKLFGKYTICIVICFGIAIFVPINKAIKEQSQVRYFAYTQKWENILSLVDKTKSQDRIVNFYTDLALYFTGKLNIEMFKYPQTWGAYGLYLGYFTETTTLMENSDMWYYLGHIGASKYWASESQTVYENNPRILKRLIETNIITGNYPAAWSFLKKLSHSPMHKAEVNRFEKCLTDSNFLNNEAELQLKKHQMIKFDFFLDKKNPKQEFYDLLAQDSTNRMAYEYLQAYHLMKHELSPFIKNIKKLEYIGYTSLPPIYEQAILVYSTEKKPDIGNWKVSQASIENFNSYMKNMDYYNGNLQLAQPQIAKFFADTYWYFMQYAGPIATNKEIKMEHEE